MYPISRERAKELNLRWYYTGKPCKHGHMVERTVSDQRCKECGKIRRQNPEWKRKKEERRKKWRAKPENKAKELAYAKKYAKRKSLKTKVKKPKTGKLCNSVNAVARRKALKEGKTRYFTGEPCKHGHLSERRVKGGVCVECERIRLKSPHNKKLARKRYEKCKEDPDKYGRMVELNRLRMREYRLDPEFREAESKKNKTEEGRKRSRKYNKTRRQKEEHKAYMREYMLDFYKNKPQGQLRAQCCSVLTRLNAALDDSRFEYLDYTAEQWHDHIIKTAPQFESVREAREAGWHVDHIVPVSFIAKNVDDKELAFKMAMDLNNMRLIPGEENLSKNASLEESIVTETFDVLCERYL